MNFIDLIIKKRKGMELNTDEINYFVKGVTDETIPDYQVSAMLMAICINSLTDRETADLTMAMTYSGDVLDLSAIDGITVDKHSTGGVGDTTTLILAPLTASLGLKVMKMSGRGLGHTGGTLDKLESIPGFNVSLTGEKAIEQVNKINIAIMGQSADLAPADKRLYALRDVTGTVESIPLIAASIMSKKLAAGTDAIVLDVKCGNGAFMKNIDDAKKLAQTMVAIGKHLGRKTCALITPMDRPLGDYIGNSLEVIEAIEILRGEKEGRLKDVALELGAKMLVLGDIASNEDIALDMLRENIKNHKGIDKFKELISSQGGNAAVCDDTSLLPLCSCKTQLKSTESGYITSIDTELIGRAGAATGAGRTVKDEPVEHGAGIKLYKTVGDYVEKGDLLADIFAPDDVRLSNAVDLLQKAYKFGDTVVNSMPCLMEVIE